MEPTLQVTVSIETLEDVRAMLKRHKMSLLDVATYLDRDEKVTAGYILGGLGGEMAEMREQLALSIPHPKE